MGQIARWDRRFLPAGQYPRAHPTRQGAVEPRVSIVTLGVGDLGRSVALYRDGLGWPSSGAVEGDEVTFFKTGGGGGGLFPQNSFAGGAGGGLDALDHGALS